MTLEQKLQEYKEFVLSKEVKNYNEIELTNQDKRALHALLGLSTEANELLDNFKKKFYGKPLDIVNIKEECGDLFFFLMILFDVYGLNVVEIVDINMAKLNKRYAKQFTQEEALNRNLEAERIILEIS